MREKRDGKNKKLIALLVALGMVMQMAGCGQEETSGEATGDMSVEQTETLDQTTAGQESEDVPDAEEPEFVDYAIEWKDHLVERVVRENVQIPNGDVMLSDVRDLTELDFSSLNTGTLFVSDLGDLAVMPNLEKLILSANYGETPCSIVYGDDFSALSELTALKELDLGIYNINGAPIKDISSLPSMPNLTSLTVGGEFKDIQVLAGFPNLTNLSLKGNFSDISVLSNLTKLETLSLQVSVNSTEEEAAFDLGILSGLSDLKELNITYGGNGMLEGLEVLSELSGLEAVRLNVSAFSDGYSAHLNLDVLSGLSNLKTLEIEGCEIENLSGLAGCSNLKSLRVSTEYVESLPDLPNLEELFLFGYAVTSLHLPDLSGLKKLTLMTQSGADMSALSNLSSLTELSMNCWDRADLPALPALPTLETLSVAGDFIAINQGAWSGLTSLKSLDMAGCSYLKDISALSDLVSLETLDLSKCGVENLTPLAGLVNLKELNLGKCASVSDLSALSGLTNLKRLDLGRYRDLGGSPLKDISGLSDLVSLETLDLSWCGVEDLTPLAGLVNLGELNLSGCNVSDLNALSGLTNLKKLDLSRCEGIDDYSPVSFVQELIQ